MLKKSCLFSILFLISPVHSMENNESPNTKVAQSYQLIQKKAQQIYYGGEVCMDPLRKHIISGGSTDYSGTNRMGIFDEEGNELKQVQVDAYVISALKVLADDPDNVAIGSDTNNLIIYNLNTNSQVSSVDTGHGITALLSLGNNLLVSGGYSGNLLIWNLQKNTPLPCVGHNGTITALIHNSTKTDDNWFVSTDDQKRVCIWDYNSKCLNKLDKYGGNALGIWQLKTDGPYINGTYIIVGGDKISLLWRQNGGFPEVESFGWKDQSGITDLKVTNDNNYVITAGNDFKINIYKNVGDMAVEVNCIATCIGHYSPISQILLFKSDQDQSQLIASISGAKNAPVDNTLRVWGLDGKQLATSDNLQLPLQSFCKNGNVIAIATPCNRVNATYKGNLYIYNLVTTGQNETEKSENKVLITENKTNVTTQPNPSSSSKCNII